MDALANDFWLHGTWTFSFLLFFFFLNYHYFLMACEVSMLATHSVTLKMGCIKVTEGDEKEKQYTKLFFSFKLVKSQMIPE